ncbi:PROTEIN SWEETIE [Salix koriyanagi]|uniref:PROTEIN SWEETIE n=1 Tax=Salix koriyanagi TaxID=2511006 RepID=A0A9Q0V025_9ROSI|nr:PROTEIN SWEETIE [Salix koriyanagi]
MALSSLVPQTMSSISLLAKSTITGLQIWSLYGLLLTIEASGFSYVTHVQATLGLALGILLSEENGLVDFQQGVGRLINAIVAVLGPELAPGSIFFSRCKSVIAEISSWQETATLLESVRFTQQLVLFAPQAVSVHTHVQTLLSTLSSGQPTLRHLAVSTLRHLIEKDPVSISDEQIEDSLFHMLNEETDSVIGSLVQATIMRLLLASCPSCPSHWILICRNMVLATLGRQDTDTNRSAGNDPSNGPDNDSGMDLGEDDENMVSGSKGMPMQGSAFAAECLSHLPIAVGKNPAHFDLSLARKQYTNGGLSRDWLVLHVQVLISLAYQISTIQFENMRPIGVGLLTAILDKFEKSPDPELPGHLLLEQYQAQLVSAVRTALDASSGPILIEAGLQLATKIMTSGVLGGDQVAVKGIFSLISRPLNDFKDVYYPSFAEWVSCKIKIRLLAAHASLKCYTFSFLRRHHSGVPDEYLALLPLFSKSSSILRKYWIGVLKDYSYICLCLDAKKNWNPFLDGIQSPLVSSKVQLSLEECWPVILQALALDAIPVNTHGDSKATDENTSNNSLISGYSMVELELEDYRFLWGFSLLVLFQRKHPALTRRIILSSAEVRYSGDSPTEETSTAALKQYEIVLPVFQFLLTERFFTEEYITMDICRELLQVFFYSIYMDNSWNTLSLSVLSQIVQNCPADFLEAVRLSGHGTSLGLYLQCFFRDHLHCEELISPLFIAAKILVKRCEPKKQLKSVVVALVLVGYKCIREAMTELSFSTVNDFVKCTTPLMKNLIDDSAEQVYESQYCRQTEDSSTICLAVLKYCTKYIQTVLNDSNVQVQAIGLQALKTMTQRSANIEDISFFTFFSGELIIFHIIHNSLKKPVSKESVAIAGECLRFLVLLQTLSKANECQRGFMNLLLKAIVMIFSASEDDSSQEVSDIRTNAVRLVSSLAQIPSSAVCFKDVLLSMPVSHKQQLQGVIRASVAQHQNASPMKTMASLEIKLPVPKDSQTSSVNIRLFYNIYFNIKSFI